MIVPITSLTGKLRVRLVDTYGRLPFTTFWASIEDDDGHRANVCIDGRQDSATRHRLFDQARYPSNETAKLIDLGAPAEDLVIGLLSCWYDSEECVKSGFSELGRELLQEALLSVRLLDPDCYLPNGNPGDAV